jgi:hypothetical protein
MGHNLPTPVLHSDSNSAKNLLLNLLHKQISWSHGEILACPTHFISTAAGTLLGPGQVLAFPVGEKSPHLLTASSIGFYRIVI